jgi:hypothetical protein
MSFRACERKLLDLGLAAYNRGIGLSRRSEQPYATHIPVLVGVAAAIKPRRLIEFGCGTFSTLSFLDDVAFPSIEVVDSYENNKEWFEQISRELPPNSPIRLHLVIGDMYRTIDGASTPDASMIFVDDSPSAEERVQTVQGIARCCGTEPVVVLHDYNLWRLRLAARNFQNRLSFDAFNPQCGVLWNGRPERRLALKRVSDIIRRYARSIPPGDVRRWRRVFSEAGL